MSCGCDHSHCEVVEKCVCACHTLGSFEIHGADAPTCCWGKCPKCGLPIKFEYAHQHQIACDGSCKDGSGCCKKTA